VKDNFNTQIRNKNFLGKFKQTLKNLYFLDVKIVRYHQVRVMNSKIN